MIRPDDRWKYSEFLVNIMFGVYATMWVEASVEPVHQFAETTSFLNAYSVLPFEPRFWLGVSTFFSLLCLWWWYTSIFLEWARNGSTKLLILDLVLLACFSLGFRLWSGSYVIFGGVFLVAMLVLMVRFQMTVAVVESRDVSTLPKVLAAIFRITPDPQTLKTAPPEYRALVVGRNWLAAVLAECAIGAGIVWWMSPDGLGEAALAWIMVILVLTCLAGTVRAMVLLAKAEQAPEDSPLFYSNNSSLFRLGELRETVRRRILDSHLIHSARNGSRDAARALHVGFWPFIREFESIIDRRGPLRDPLSARFGRKMVRHKFGKISSAVREMKHEEGTHAGHWHEDTKGLGVTDMDVPTVNGVGRLIQTFKTESLQNFFSMLAATEILAEELAGVLTSSNRYTNLFATTRWSWGDIHVKPHEHGPSHLDIDLDLARAYSPNDAAAEVQVRKAVIDMVDLFASAADEVEAELVYAAPAR